MEENIAREPISRARVPPQPESSGERTDRQGPLLAAADPLERARLHPTLRYDTNNEA